MSSHRRKDSLSVPPSKGSPQSPSTPPASKSTSPRVSVSGQPTVSSLTKVTTKKELVTIKTRLVSTSSKSTPSLGDGGLKKSSANGKEVQAVAANLPLDSLCLCFEKLESVYHVVTCGAVCQHWREAACSDVVILRITFLWSYYVISISTNCWGLMNWHLVDCQVWLKWSSVLIDKRNSVTAPHSGLIKFDISMDCTIVQKNLEGIMFSREHHALLDCLSFWYYPPHGSSCCRSWREYMAFQIGFSIRRINGNWWCVG